ncbi:MAG: mannose-6-phosphate isomerase, class I [Spirochaetales bacterium]|jgi:mannose-6-phosphate isomerase|nr:mannose-6-phosphate isomerase, class I [Spirochaetales bacterium]
MLYQLENTIQKYAWGSASLMPDFLGRENPEKEPWAELWMGAHPKAPSLARPASSRGKAAPLDELIAAGPAAFLGGKNLNAFGAQLPFLFKLLAAASPLSIQCHPSLNQARAGFERENRAGLAADSPERNYRDANHKPEIILAVTPFSALRGLRPVQEIAHFFSGFPVPELRELARGLTRADAGENIKTFLRYLLSAPARSAKSWIASLKAQSGSCAAGENLPEYRAFVRLSDFYPEDAGCLAPFYLNLVQLAPGEALFLGPGELHAYLEGLGVELMANSDNVLRAGLTPKHIDVQELLAVVSCAAAKAEILRPAGTVRGGFVEEEYPRRAEEFTLSVLRPKAGDSNAQAVIETGGPEILFCGGGGARLTSGSAACRLAKGESVFVPASEKNYTLSGRCLVYRARVPS